MTAGAGTLPPPPRSSACRSAATRCSNQNRKSGSRTCVWWIGICKSLDKVGQDAVEVAEDYADGRYSREARADLEDSRDALTGRNPPPLRWAAESYAQRVALAALQGNRSTILTRTWDDAAAAFAQQHADSTRRPALTSWPPD